MNHSSELTASDLHAWFLVYCASTRSGSFLESKTRGSRSELVLYHKVIKCWCILKSFLDLRCACYFRNAVRMAYLDPLKNPFDSFFSQGNSLAFLLKRDVQSCLFCYHKLLDTVGADNCAVVDDGKLDRKGLCNSAWFWPDLTSFNQYITGTSVLYFLTFLSLFSWDPIFLNLWDKLARQLAHLPRMSRLDTWCHTHSLSENVSEIFPVLILNRLSNFIWHDGGNYVWW